MVNLQRHCFSYSFNGQEKMTAIIPVIKFLLETCPVLKFECDGFIKFRTCDCFALARISVDNCANTVGQELESFLEVVLGCFQNNLFIFFGRIGKPEEP